MLALTSGGGEWRSSRNSNPASVTERWAPETKVLEASIGGTLSRVRTYTERHIAPDVQAEMPFVIDGTRLIVFLGFEFHQTNMALLRAISAASWCRVIATVGVQNFETPTLSLATSVGCSDTRKVQGLPWHSQRIFSASEADFARAHIARDSVALRRACEWANGRAGNVFHRLAGCGDPLPFAETPR